jgi:hypothetical protein
VTFAARQIVKAATNRTYGGVEQVNRE